MFWGVLFLLATTDGHKHLVVKGTLFSPSTEHFYGGAFNIFTERLLAIESSSLYRE